MQDMCTDFSLSLHCHSSPFIIKNTKIHKTGMKKIPQKHIRLNTLGATPLALYPKFGCILSSRSQDMNDQFELEEAVVDEKEQKMGSLNHSLAQGQIISQLSTDKRFRVMPELSLGVGQLDLSQFGLKAKEELKPDICVYPNTVRGKKRDIIKMSDMPLLAIEVISSSQSIDEIVIKFDAYFALGIKSCWLVTPVTKSIVVYCAPNSFEVFSMKDAELVDEVMDIRLPIQDFFEDIFEW
jgi:Uma2 family endonuclease